MRLLPPTIPGSTSFPALADPVKACMHDAGWKERTSWEEGLKRTVDWYLAHGFKDYWNTADVEAALAPHPVMHSQPRSEL